MKISKLFHWLYASVMLMPIFAIGFKCLYVTFNPNAKDSYYGETINQVNYERVNSFNNLIGGNNYKYVNNISSVDLDYRIDTVLYVENFKDVTGTLQLPNDLEVETLRFYVYERYSPMLRINNQSQYTFSLLNPRDMEFTFINGTYLTYNEILCYCFDIQYNDYTYIDNVFYYSVEQIGNEPLFNWANNTFLNSPLLYITNLFGVPSTSPIITLLCFWFSVSIIWLVFDMLMYVPLLVHRWLDKGVLE